MSTRHRPICARGGSSQSLRPDGQIAPCARRAVITRPISPADRPLNKIGDDRSRLFAHGGRIQIAIDGQRLPDRSLLRDVAQPVERRAFRHWKLLRPAGRSGRVSASCCSSVRSGSVSGTVRARMASSWSRATATSSSADSGRLVLKNLISGAPFSITATPVLSAT